MKYRTLFYALLTIFLAQNVLSADESNFSLLGPMKLNNVSKGDCEKKQGEVAPQATALSLISLEAAENLSCMGLSTYDRFSEKNCEVLTRCSDSKTARNNIDRRDQRETRKYMAEDYISAKLGKEFKEMNKIEAIRRFSELKYKKSAGTCSSPFDYEPEESACNASLMVGGFERMDEESRPFHDKGHKKYILPFLEKKHVSISQDYFRKKIADSVKKTMESESKVLDALAEIISSKNTKAEKIEKIFDRLNSFKKNSELDPILGYENDSYSAANIDIKQSLHYKFFDELSARNLGIESVKNAIVQYKMTTAENLLGSKCQVTAHLSEICRNASEIYESKRMSKSESLKLNRDEVQSFLPEDKENDERFVFLKGIYPNGIIDLNDFKIYMDAKRCKTFNFESETSPQAHPIRKKGLFDKFNLGNLGSANGISSELKRSHEVEMKVGGVKEAIEAKREGSSEEAIHSNDLKNEEKKPDSKETSTNSGHYNTAFNSQSSAFVDDESSSKTPEKMTGKANPVSTKNAALNDRISELNKKLASSEENLERIKNQKLADDAEKERLQKISVENNEIADLKNQINDLKKETQKNGDTNGPTEPANGELKPKAEIVQQDNRFEETRSMVATAKAEATEAGAKQLANVSSMPVDSSVRSPGSKAATSTGEGTSKLASAKSGLVLTKIDGMSIEKGSEAIASKIMEMNGVPFYIEEGGFIKEIVPILKNGKVVFDDKGKPLFEKIVKGKVGDKKGRSVASINDPADLKRDEEMQIKRAQERAEYLKLQKMTNELIDRNK